jgi:hypothetical protein
LVVPYARHEIIFFFEIIDDGTPLIFARWTILEVLIITSFHDNFKNILPLGHDNLKLIVTINLFYVRHVFFSLGCNKSNDLTMLLVGLVWFP